MAAGSFREYEDQLKKLGLQNRVIVRENAGEVQDYLQAADMGIYTSESESFCLGILEGMWFGKPSAAMAVGGIPEVVKQGDTGALVPFGDVAALAAACTELIDNPARRAAMGAAAQAAARGRFSAEAIVPQYEGLYRRLL
jgi:glycosyltransferase involved in cell wall biosynthesis